MLIESRANFIPNILNGCVPLTAETSDIIAHEEGLPGLCYCTYSVRFGSINTCQSLVCIYREFSQILYLSHFEVTALVDGFILNKLQTAGEVSEFTHHQKRERHIFLPESDLNCCYFFFFGISIFILVYVLMTDTHLLLFELNILLSHSFAFTNIHLAFFPQILFFKAPIDVTIKI